MTEFAAINSENTNLRAGAVLEFGMRCSLCREVVSTQHLPFQEGKSSFYLSNGLDFLLARDCSKKLKGFKPRFLR